MSALTHGQLLQHQDGGLYRFLFVGWDTSTNDNVGVYEHLYPFKAETKYVRPMVEFTPKRFKFITEQQYWGIVSLNDDDEKFRQQIVAAKAVRRQAECNCREHFQAVVSSCTSYFITQCSNCGKQETIDRD